MLSVFGYTWYLFFSQISGSSYEARKGVVMKRRDFLLVLLVAGLSAGLTSGIGLYFLFPSIAIAQNESTIEKEFREFKKSKAEAEEKKREHMENLKLTEKDGIILNDKMGRRRATLATDHNGDPFLEFYDKDGKVLLKLNSEELFIDSAESKWAASISPFSFFIRHKEQQGNITKTKSTTMWAGVPKPVETLTVCNYNDPSKETVGFKTYDIDCLNPTLIDEEKLMLSAKSLSNIADECLKDVRDKKRKYEESSNCQALGPLSMQYTEAGGWLDLDSLSEHARIANSARTTAWMARAVSASGGKFLSIW